MNSLFGDLSNFFRFALFHLKRFSCSIKAQRSAKFWLTYTFQNHYSRLLFLNHLIHSSDSWFRVNVSINYPWGVSFAVNNKTAMNFNDLWKYSLWVFLSSPDSFKRFHSTDIFLDCPFVFISLEKDGLTKLNSPGSQQQSPAIANIKSAVSCVCSRSGLKNRIYHSTKWNEFCFLRKHRVRNLREIYKRERDEKEEFIQLASSWLVTWFWRRNRIAPALGLYRSWVKSFQKSWAKDFSDSHRTSTR